VNGLWQVPRRQVWPLPVIQRWVSHKFAGSGSQLQPTLAKNAADESASSAKDPFLPLKLGLKCSTDAVTAMHRMIVFVPVRADEELD
jgi:hypothetical protein